MDRPVYIFPADSNHVYYLKDTIDLRGGIYKMPNGVTIKPRGGLIKNGTLIGSRTKINANKCIFDGLIIEGEWVVPKISTSLFKTKNEVNFLQNVLALASSNMHNDIYIEKGIYRVSSVNGNACLRVLDNTDITLEGEIILEPNSFPGYSVLNITGSNVIIRGSGTIAGDRNEHKGSDGEWGMGVMISGGNNVTIRGVTIQNCWGDCVYVAGRSTNILIDRCHLLNGRRQGVSVTSADGVNIKDCAIEDIGGIPPSFAIDIEPNKHDTVCNVTIKNVRVQNCVGGIVLNSVASKTCVANVVIDNCHIRSLRGESGIACLYSNAVAIRNCDILNDKNCIYITDSKTVSLSGCSIEAKQGATAIYTNNNKDVKVINNFIKSESDAFRDSKEVLFYGNDIECRKVFTSTNNENEIIKTNKVRKYEEN